MTYKCLLPDGFPYVCGVSWDHGNRCFKYSPQSDQWRKISTPSWDNVTSSDFSDAFGLAAVDNNIPALIVTRDGENFEELPVPPVNAWGFGCTVVLDEKQGRNFFDARLGVPKKCEKFVRYV